MVIVVAIVITLLLAPFIWLGLAGFLIWWNIRRESRR
jgi:hypothetical protein